MGTRRRGRVSASVPRQGSQRASWVRLGGSGRRPWQSQQWTVLVRAASSLSGLIVGGDASPSSCRGCVVPLACVCCVAAACALYWLAVIGSHAPWLLRSFVTLVVCRLVRLPRVVFG